MSRLSAALAQPRTWTRIHGTFTVAWTLLMIPSLLWWQESVPWLVIMSCWANIAGSAASWQSARADRNSPSREDLERVGESRSALADCQLAALPAMFAQQLMITSQGTDSCQKSSDGIISMAHTTVSPPCTFAQVRGDGARIAASSRKPG